MMRYDGIGGVKRMKIRLYPPEMDDDVIAPKAGSILAGYDPRVNFGVEVGFGPRLREIDEAILYGPTIARPDPTETCLIEAVFDEMMAKALQGLGGATMRPSPQQMAEMLARQGRGSDTEVAHVARGEIVLPKALQNPEVMAAIRKAAAPYKVPVEMLSVGNAMNRINPKTGAPEFDPNWPDRMKGWFGFGDDASQNDGPNLDGLDDVNKSRFAPQPDNGAPSIPAPPSMADLPSVNDALRTSASGIVSPDLQSDFAQAKTEMARQMPTTQQINQSLYRGYLQDPRVSAALDTVQRTEGGKMGIWTGGKPYPNPLSPDHPGLNPNGSSAAGPYQFTKDTWKTAQGMVGPLDFSNPEDQKVAAVALWDQKKALDPLVSGNFDGFLEGASNTWQSLPEGAGEKDKSRFPIPTYEVTGPGGLSYDPTTGDFQPNFQIEQKERNPAWRYDDVVKLYNQNLDRYR